METATLRAMALAIGTGLLAGPALAQEEAPAEASQPATASTDAESVILVLDGSGSMWGQVDEVPKIEIARSVIGDLLEDWNPDIHLGLVAYGHREKGDCGDIETLVDVGPVDADATLAAIADINPKGKTPISASVVQAAEALKYTEEKATVILVSDGLETCDADPCAVASQLESDGVDFTAHVIGFDLEAEDQAQLACLAENTGGSFISAGNASELTDALTTTVDAVAEAPPAPEPAVVEPEPESEPIEQGVQLSARMCAECEMQEGVYWRILEGEADLNGKRKQLETSGADTPFIALSAGNYQVVAKYGDAVTTQAFTVPEGEGIAVDVNLNAGNLRVTPTATEGGEVLDDAMYYRVFAAETDLEGNRNEVAVSGSDRPVFHLSAGDYVIQAKHGAAVVETPVTVVAGELVDLTMALNVGYLRLDASMAEGGPPIEDGLYYRVLSARQDLSGDREQVDVSGSETPLFRLPAGDYIVRVRHGAAEIDHPVSVTAGELGQARIVMNSARFKATAVAEAGGSPLADVYWRVLEGEEALDGSRDQIDASGADEPIFTVPAGRYIIRARFGGKDIDQPVTLAPGEEQRVEVNVNP